MEILTTHLQLQSKVGGSDGSQKDILEWCGVYFDSKNKIIRINWQEYHLGGSLPLEWLPSTIAIVFVSRNELDGSACLTQLPTDFTKLPESLFELWMSDTELEGAIEMVNWNDFQAENSNVKMTYDYEKVCYSILESIN